MIAYQREELDDPLNPQLADLIAEALVWSEQPSDRAQVLVQIVTCALDALGWRLEPGGEAHEELSAREILHAATAHLARMQR